MRSVDYEFLGAERIETALFYFFFLFCHGSAEEHTKKIISRILLITHTEREKKREGVLVLGLLSPREGERDDDERYFSFLKQIATRTCSSFFLHSFLIFLLPQKKSGKKRNVESNAYTNQTKKAHNIESNERWLVPN